MKKASIDIETFSKADLPKTGVYRYAEDPSFEVMLFGISIDDGPVVVYDLKQGDVLPDSILDVLMDNKVSKWAFNAQFERICLSRYLWDLGRLEKGTYLDPRGWRCDMVWAGYMGFPMSLKNAGEALGLPEQKMKEGREMITYFCKPYRATSRNGYGDRNLPVHAPEKWELFKAYNKRDVEVEMNIHQRLSAHAVPDFVWSEYWMDQTINDRGIQVDLAMVRNAIRLYSLSQERLLAELQSLTGLPNPRSVIQLKRWFDEQGFPMDSLDKESVASALKLAEPPLDKVLYLWQEIAKSAVKKYQAMENAVCSDGRLRGMFRFYGANRSGRFSGSIVQLQNLYRNDLTDLEEARALVAAGDYSSLEMLYNSVPEVLAQCVRTAFIPATPYKLIVADFSAIEARVLAWLAGEQWRMDAFSQGEDIYCASASQMFHVPVVKHGINSHLRQKGKIAELALGYGGSVGALTAMGALDMGLTEEELQPLVSVWRTSNPRITRLWKSIDRTARTAIKKKTTSKTHGLTFTYRGGMLYITLPSSRQLCYVRPRMGQNRFGSESITYLGNDITRNFSRIETFGGKLTENIVQAISRDILCYAMKQLSEYRIVAHVHDECIVECPEETTVEAICSLMSRVPPWAPGLILRADGYECPGFYMKD